MKVDKTLLDVMTEKAKQNDESINCDNFLLYSCESVVDRFIDSLIEMECNIEDIYMIKNMLLSKLSKCPIKKEEEKLPSF